MIHRRQFLRRSLPKAGAVTLKDTFWLDLLDVFQRHGVVELEPITHGEPARIIFHHDETSGQGEFVVANVQAISKLSRGVPLPGTSNIHAYLHETKISVRPEYSLRGLLEYAGALVKQARRR